MDGRSNRGRYLQVQIQNPMLVSYLRLDSHRKFDPEAARSGNTHSNKSREGQELNACMDSNRYAISPSNKTMHISISPAPSTAVEYGLPS